MNSSLTGDVSLSFKSVADLHRHFARSESPKIARGLALIIHSLASGKLITVTTLLATAGISDLMVLIQKLIIKFRLDIEIIVIPEGASFRLKHDGAGGVIL